MAPPPISVGRVIAGRYRVERSIGGGGMGHVFEVVHEALGRHFALKVLRIVGGWDEELVRRFEREAKALARVGSPRVAQVSDFGVEDGIGPWFVMELVDGDTLQERLDRTGAVPAREALRFAIGLCEAVEDVHVRGIVHRDLKPANIGLPPGPIPLKLLDFGLAAGIDDELLTRITKSHQVMGSLPYIAPEQFAGSRPGKPQDIWAMGIVLYEMFTGRLPFEAPSTAALMHKILTAPPPALDHFDSSLRAVLGALLVKNPADRLASAAEAARMLQAIDPETLTDSLHLAPPSLTEGHRALVLTPPHAITEQAPTARRSGEAAHVSSGGISMQPEMAPVPSASHPSGATATTPRPWLAVGAVALILALLALVGFLALRTPVSGGDEAETGAGPVPVQPELAPEPAAQPEIAPEAPTPIRPERPPVEPEVVPEPTPEPAPTNMQRRRSRRRSTMETPMESPSQTTMQTPTSEMGSSSWMGEIIGGGWSGDIIEGGR